MGLPSPSPNPSRKPEPPSRTAFADWQAQLRTALFEAVTPEDIREVVANLKDKAKKGDRGAIDLLFRYVIGPSTVSVKNAVIVQDNRPLTPLPTAPTRALAGTTDKFEVISRRARNGQALFDPRDATRDES